MPPHLIYARFKTIAFPMAILGQAGRPLQAGQHS